jgi:hypothetical protein
LWPVEVGLAAARATIGTIARAHGLDFSGVAAS